ncbi:MAG: Ppx/GppA family phosphatase [Clostridia bacterium]|nr:Ppx/GppA family phosphatase [Clostridia bacterium]
MRISAIEIGTNSTKFIIVDEVGDGNFKVIEKTSTVNRLSKSMYDSNNISEEAMENGIKIVGEYVELSKNSNSNLVAIFSTSVLRDAGNRQYFTNRVKELYGMNVDVISGDREAYLAYKACSSLIDKADQRFAVIDIGGGSTEITVGNKSSIDYKVSIDIGAVRLTEMFVKNDPLSQEDITNIADYAARKIDESQGLDLKGIRLVGTGGTVKTIATMFKKKHYKEEKAINGTSIGLEDIETIYDSISKLSIEEKKQLEGLNPKRADVIVAGVIILLSVMRKYDLREITVSSQGVLEGFIEDYIYSMKE